MRTLHDRVTIDSYLKFNIIYLVRVLNIYVYYRWFVLREWIYQSNFTSKANPEMCDTLRNPFQTKHIYGSYLY